jgi:putative membrane protein
MHDWAIGFGLLPFGWIFMLIFWAVVIIGLITLVRWLLGKPFPGGVRETPLDVLKRRYAAGEIDREQYERMKADLEE